MKSSTASLRGCNATRLRPAQGAVRPWQGGPCKIRLNEGGSVYQTRASGFQPDIGARSYHRGRVSLFQDLGSENLNAMDRRAQSRAGRGCYNLPQGASLTVLRLAKITAGRKSRQNAPGEAQTLET